MFRSTVTQVGGTAEAPDYVYYNADIINNETRDQAAGLAIVDPPVRFNETRDAPLVRDASQYYFSIVRFSMDGPNRDLPILIPTIQQGTGQNNPNLTTYGMAISYQQDWNTSDVGLVSITAAPAVRFLDYISESQNPTQAPNPGPLSAPTFRGLWNIANTYAPGDIVNVVLGGQIFYQVIQPQQWSPLVQYQIGDFVQYGTLGAFRAIAVPPIGVPPVVGPNWVLGITGFAPALNPQYWSLVGNNLGQPQNLTSRYYWVYTYQHWVDLVNNTFNQAINDTYLEFQNQWTLSGTADPFPYPTLASFLAFVNVPQMVYNPSTKRFSIYADSDGYGTRLTPFTPQPAQLGPPPVAGQQTPPQFRVFFNTNMYGLFANFVNTYWNDTSTTSGPFGGTPPAPVGYVNEILFPNKFYQNVADYRLAPFNGVAPLGYVPAAQQKPYWVTEQDFQSTDSIWSPISSIVFTSTLLPIKAEATGQPIVLGGSNDGFSAPTTQAAFQPIITDVALDTSAPTGAEGYKNFIYYAPVAEYRLTDFAPSKVDIRNVDIQVYWKNRLSGELYPVRLFNLSSVSVKIMFRRKGAQDGSVQ